MHTTHTTFILAGHTVHNVTFAPTTFTDADLLWLPHYAELSNAGRKRKAEHLAFQRQILTWGLSGRESQS